MSKEKQMDGRVTERSNSSTTTAQAPTGTRLKLMTETLGRISEEASDRLDTIMEALDNIEEMIDEIHVDVGYTNDRIADLAFRVDRMERALERIPKGGSQ
jgi:hypothetical protein